jgi:hypothetical protein
MSLLYLTNLCHSIGFSSTEAQHYELIQRFEVHILPLIGGYSVINVAEIWSITKRVGKMSNV